MSFDLATATPVGESVGFDISTATPVEVGTEQPRELPPGTVLDSIFEPVQAMGSSLAGSAIGGASGLVSLPFEGVDKSVDLMQDIQSSFNEMGAPETQAGVEAMVTIGDIVEGGYDKFLKTPLALLGAMGS
jgi:hypothetical protein